MAKKSQSLLSAKWLLLLLGVIFVGLSVYHEVRYLISFVVWLGVMVIAFQIISEPTKTPRHSPYLLKDVAIICLICLAILVFWTNHPYHYHFDEYITAFTSLQLHSPVEINWFGAVPGNGEWVCQFPLLFHLLQKPFFLSGPSKIAIFLSTLPYILGSLLFLYLLSHRFLSRKMAWLASLSYIFLSPQQYLGSLGLHFHSSTFFFTAALYFFLSLLEDKKYYQGALLGFFSALAYLTYSSSYLTLPVLLLLGVLRVAKDSDKTLMRLGIKTLFVFTLILFPFLVYALGVNNYFMGRYDQVNIISGSWRSPDEIANGFSELFTIVFYNFVQAVRAFYLSGVGGMGDYWFGRQSFFNVVSGSFFIIGAFWGVWKTIFGRSFFWATVLFSILSAFTLGVVLTTQPPAFHRFSVVYPLVGLIIAAGMEYLFSLISRLTRVKILPNSILILALLAYIIVNFVHTGKMIKSDKEINSNDIVKASKVIVDNYPNNTNIYVAAFPANAFGKELMFRLNGNYPITTNFLSEFSPDPKKNYLLILHLPNEESLSELNQRFPKAQLVKSTNDGIRYYGLVAFNRYPNDSLSVPDETDDRLTDLISYDLFYIPKSLTDGM